MNVVGEMALVFSLQRDICLRVCVTSKQKSSQHVFKQVQIIANEPCHEVSCAVSLKNKVLLYTNIFSIDTEAIHSVLRRQNMRKFKYFFYKQTNK
jgi:hypothetical protein